MSKAPVRVRVAPSPTGDPHVGTAYIALFNFVFAKCHGGQFVLRIEDTDQARSRADSEVAILEALKWVGLTWDEGPDIGGKFGPYRQSERQSIYVEHAAQLLELGTAYRCFCTPERLTEVRAAQRAAKKSLGYDGHCRTLTAEEVEAKLADNIPHVVRLKVPREADTKVIVHDELRGDVEISTEQVDDQVLLKTDGFPTYHLASVVDDHLMEISHVIRAEEWISSTPKHVLLYQAFGWEQPKWIHMPLLRNKDSSKISKRKNPVSLNFYKEVGILPEAMVNFLGIMGWSFGGDREKFTVDEMIEVFSWDRISLGGPVFDVEKLRWMNEQYIHELSDEELTRRLLEWRLNSEFIGKLVPHMKKRIKQLSDFIPGTEYFFSADINYEPIADKLAVPDVPGPKLKKMILELVERYEALVEFSTPELERVSKEFCAEKEWKNKHLFMLLRYGVTGRKASPPLFESMVAMGKEVTRYRLRNVATFVGSRK